MANEQLTIQPNDARMTVIGKSWPDASTDSGGGPWDDTYDGTYSGPIPRTDLPTKIAVTTPPWKTRYYQNDVFNDAGMVVTAYREDDTVWTSEKYPDGTIPFWELIHDFVIKKYDEYDGYVKGGGGAIFSVNSPNQKIMWHLFRPGIYDYGKYSGEGYVYAPYGNSRSIILGGDTVYCRSHEESLIKGGSLFYIPSGNYALLNWFASDSPYYYKGNQAIPESERPSSYDQLVQLINSDEMKEYVYNHLRLYTVSNRKNILNKDGKTVYLSGFDSNSHVTKPSPLGHGTETYYNARALLAAWNALYDNERIIDFPISWPRPEDGMILSTSIKITVVGSNNSFV